MSGPHQGQELAAEEGEVRRDEGSQQAREGRNYREFNYESFGFSHIEGDCCGSVTNQSLGEANGAS
jgi:hypothetical protein